jgi:FkbM family methyltransferase
MQNDLIYDVGMNNGDDAAYYLSRGYRVVAVEAHPDLAVQGSRRFIDEIAAGRLTLINAAIVDAAAAEIDFWRNDDYPEWSSFHADIAGRAGHRISKVRVPCMTMRELIGEHGVPYYLKIDIEGNDELCLAGLSYDDPPAHLSLENFTAGTLDLLRAVGFDGFKFIDQASFCPITLPPDPELLAFWQVEERLAGGSLSQKIYRGLVGPMKRKAVSQRRHRDGWSFPAGSSGAFGDDTAGKWLSYDEAMEIFQYYEFAPRNGSWAWRDLHARASRAVSTSPAVLRTEAPSFTAKASTPPPAAP